MLPTGGGQALLDPSDTVILLLDHQSGLLQTVKDVSLPELRANVVMLVLSGLAVFTLVTPRLVDTMTTLFTGDRFVLYRIESSQIADARKAVK